MPRSKKLTLVATTFLGKKEGSSSLPSNSASEETNKVLRPTTKSWGTRNVALVVQKIKQALASSFSFIQTSLKKTALLFAFSKKTPDWSTTPAQPILKEKSFFSRSVVRSFIKLLTLPIRNPILRVITISFFLVLVGSTLYVLKDLPSPRKLTAQENFAVSSQILDRNGVLLYEVYGDENRTPIKIDSLPPHVYQAAIAIEDQRFYHHFGIDIIGVVRALANNFQGQPIEGGSTITQQLVKNALLTNEKTLQRKVKEAFLAVITEVIYSKEEILEMYLNYISYGGTAVGIESAARQYFDKPASELSIAEAALLAGLPQAPSRYSPFQSDSTRAKERQAEVLRRMTEDKYITAIQAEEALAQPLTYAISKTDIKAPHFVFYVRDLLYQQFGEETVEKGGLRVYTTLDIGLQETAQASVSAEVANLTRYRVGNGAALITKPDTGEILAMVGSRDYFDTEKDGQVNVTLALRQPGSSIKPLVYATAFQEKTLSPGTILLDVPTCFQIPGQKDYCPKNYDGTFKGPIEVRKALGNSLNIPAVKAMRTIGVETFLDYAQDFGLTSLQDPSRYGLSLALGGGEVRMIDMAQAFSVLANEGVRLPLTPLLRVENYSGEVLFQNDMQARKKAVETLTEYDGEEREGDAVRVLDKAPAYLISHILQDNSAREMAFGRKSELVIPEQVVSVKTGTTNDLKDNWTIGFTPEFLTITWVGNNDGSPMNQNLVSGVTGAAPIWNDLMSFVLSGKEPAWQQKPEDVSSSGVCANGVPPQNDQEKCRVRYNELFWRKTRPSESQEVKTQVWINPATGLPLKEGESADGAVLEEKTLYTDPVTSLYCDTCSRPVNERGSTIYERYLVKDETGEDNNN